MDFNNFKIDPIKWTFCTLVIIFASSSWSSTNSVWMQLPLLTAALPEAWNLPSYLTVIVQLGCIAPLIYGIVHKCTPVTVPVIPLIYVMLFVCTTTNFIMAFVWDKTGHIFGQEHSIALIVVMFFMALVNSTSDVLYIPFMSTLQPIYLIVYFIGMGFSALVPSLLALGQGVNNYHCVYDNSTGSSYPEYDKPKFSVKTYNLIIFGWLCLACISFAAIHFWKHLVERQESKLSVDETMDENSNVEKPIEPEVNYPIPRKTYIRYFTFLACLSLLNAQMNGVIPSISSFATLPYSQKTYHFALTLSNIAQPAGAIAATLYRPNSTPILLVLTAISSCFCAMIVVLAAQSPTPLLMHSYWGGFISVVSAVGAAFGQCYLRSALTASVRDDFPNDESKIFYCGVFMQLGSFIGSSVMFPLTNTLHLFKQGNSC